MSDQEIQAIIESSEENIRIASAIVVFMSVLVTMYVVLSALH